MNNNNNNNKNGDDDKRIDSRACLCIQMTNIHATDITTVLINNGNKEGSLVRKHIPFMSTCSF